MRLTLRLLEELLLRSVGTKEEGGPGREILDHLRGVVL